MYVREVAGSPLQPDAEGAGMRRPYVQVKWIEKEEKLQGFHGCTRRAAVKARFAARVSAPTLD